MHLETRRRNVPPIFALIAACTMALGLSAACAATEDDGKGVTAQTHGAGDAYAGAAAIAPTKPLDNQVVRELTIMSSTVEEAPEAAGRLRGYIAQKPDASTEAFLRRLLVRALIVMEAPAEAIVQETKLAGPGMPQSGSIRSLFYLEVSQTLAQRGAAPKASIEFARQAIADIPPDEARTEIAAFANGVLGRALLANGECRPAIETLTQAVGAAPDSQGVLYSLGAAHEACNEPNTAIDYYVRSLGVYGSTDSSAAAPLRRLYAARNGSLKGLDQKIRKSYDASLNLQVFDERRYEASMPSWTMEDSEGKTRTSAEFAGKIMVLDFWGSWCGPCRMELPHFQAMYEKFKDQGVVFYGVNWERVDRAKRKDQAMAYMQANNFDFPNVFDLDDKVTFDFQVNSFPTVFLVDGTGKFRYRNIGFNESIGDIMTLQIESLIAEQKKKGTAKK
jgi:thiol-disulfide isomerase/thioredoxin